MALLKGLIFAFRCLPVDMETFGRYENRTVPDKNPSRMTFIKDAHSNGQTKTKYAHLFIIHHIKRRACNCQLLPDNEDRE